jgi:hypothetical protein
LIHRSPSGERVDDFDWLTGPVALGHDASRKDESQGERKVLNKVFEGHDLLAESE